MPSAPRYEPRPSAPESPRYEAPRPVAPRGDSGRGYTAPETPRNDPGDTRRRDTPNSGGNGTIDGGARGGAVDTGPRYLPPDNSGRVFDGGRGAPSSRDGNGSAPSGPGAGRSNDAGRGSRGGAADSTGVGSSDPGVADNGRVWREGRNGRDPIDDLSFERRQPRTPIPVVSGSTNGADRGGSRSMRPGLSERTGRIAGEGPVRGREPVSGTPIHLGDGLVRVAQPPVTRDSILQRYREPVRDAGRAAPTSAELDARTPRDGRGDLSSGRLGVGRTPAAPIVADGARSRRDTPVRGSEEARRREREGAQAIESLRRRDPERARHVEERGRDTGRAASDATNLSVGIAVGAVTGIYAGWFWDPTCSPSHGDHGHGHHGSANWNAYWNNCWGSSWWWNYGYGFSWCNGNWTFGFGYPYGYAYRPWGSYWSYGYYSPYYWSASPACYTTIIYQDTDDSNARSVVYQDPEPSVAGEGTIAEPAGRVVGEGGAPPSASPEVKNSLVRGAVQYLELGDDAFRAGRYADAVHHYARAVEYAPEDGVLYLILSDALFATGDYHYAAFALRRSLELEPTLLENIVDKHGFYGDAAEFDRQIELAVNYLDEHFLDDDARLVLAANYLFANRPAQSADLMNSAFSRGVRETPAGQLILERAQKLREANAATTSAPR